MTAHVTASVIPLRKQTPMHPPALDERVIMLDIDQIEPYEHNPRLLRNPKWIEIERSIRASGGLTETLSVTRHPGDTKYTVHQGGNTRLLILKKLFVETTDDRFRQLAVQVQPYTNELDLAALHDRENTCRGDLTFIEQSMEQVPPVRTLLPIRYRQTDGSWIRRFSRSNLWRRPDVCRLLAHEVRRRGSLSAYSDLLGAGRHVAKGRP